MEIINKEKIQSELNRFIDLSKNILENNSIEQLNFKADKDAWSALECFEHLNRYCEYYNKQLMNAIVFKSQKNKGEMLLSWFGKKSLNIVSVKTFKKQRTLKKMNPAGSDLSKSVIDDFIEHQNTMVTLANELTEENINSKKVKVEFFKLIKMYAGETFYFMIEHQNRHLIQAQNMLEKANL